MKCALLAVFIAVMASSCGFFERKAPPERKTEVVTAVAHEALVAALPDAVADWTRNTPESTLNTSGTYQMARATVTFEKTVGDERGVMTIEIVDGLHVPSVKSRLALMMHGADDVHRMALQVAGYHGVQHWQPEKHAVGAHLVVANRFLVTLTGRHVSQDEFRRAVDGVDVRALESLIGASPPGVRSTGD